MRYNIVLLHHKRLLEEKSNNYSCWILLNNQNTPFRMLRETTFIILWTSDGEIKETGRNPCTLHV